MKLKWNVYRHNMNREKLELLNVFKHGRFVDDIKKEIKLYDSKEKFAEKLKRILFYYFGSKSEYEILIYPWIGGRDTKGVKVDIYNQVLNNFDIFLDYIWSNLKK